MSGGLALWIPVLCGALALILRAIPEDAPGAPVVPSKTVVPARHRIGADFAKRRKIYILRNQTNGRQVKLYFNHDEVISG